MLPTELTTECTHFHIKVSLHKQDSLSTFFSLARVERRTPGSTGCRPSRKKGGGSEIAPYLFDRFETDVGAYNAVAASIARELDIVVNDLFAVVTTYGRDDLLLPDGVHVKPEGYALLGRAVTHCTREVSEPAGHHTDWFRLRESAGRAASVCGASSLSFSPVCEPKPHRIHNGLLPTRSIHACIGSTVSKPRSAVQLEQTTMPSKTPRSMPRS